MAIDFNAVKSPRRKLRVTHERTIIGKTYGPVRSFKATLVARAIKRACVLRPVDSGTEIVFPAGLAKQKRGISQQGNDDLQAAKAINADVGNEFAKFKVK